MRETLKKSITGITALLLILAIFAKITFLQALPFIIFFVLAYFNLKEKRKNNHWIVILAGLMMFLNYALKSVLDVVVWGLIAISFLF